MLPGPGDEGYCRVWAASLSVLAFLAAPGGGERPAVIGLLFPFGRLLLVLPAIELWLAVRSPGGLLLLRPAAAGTDLKGHLRGRPCGHLGRL